MFVHLSGVMRRNGLVVVMYTYSPFTCEEEREGKRVFVTSNVESGDAERCKHAPTPCSTVFEKDVS